MKALIAEDEFVSRKALRAFLAPLFDVEVAVNGDEAVRAFAMAMEEGQPYELLFMDIMMPGVNGIEALKRIRAIEAEKGAAPVKVVMATALDDPKTVITSFQDVGATAYLVKPITKDKIMAELKKLSMDRGD